MTLTFPFVNSEGRLTEEDLKDVDRFKDLVEDSEFVTPWERYGVEGIDEERMDKARKINKPQADKAGSIILEYERAGKEKEEAKEELEVRGISYEIRNTLLPPSRNETNRSIVSTLEGAKESYALVGDADYLGGKRRGEREIGLYRNIPIVETIIQRYNKRSKEQKRYIRKAIEEGESEVFKHPVDEDIRFRIVYREDGPILWVIDNLSESDYYEERMLEMGPPGRAYSPKTGHGQSDSAYPIRTVVTRNEKAIRDVKRIYDKKRKNSTNFREILDGLDDERKSSKDREVFYESLKKVPQKIGERLFF